MKITMTLLCIWATLFLAGCDVKDPIYNTPHPDKGAIVISADWTRRGEGIAAPAEYITEAARTSFTLHEPVAALTGLFVPGPTELLGYNRAAHVTVKDGIATVDNDPDNAGMQHPEPGVLLAGTTVADVVADDTTSVVLPMRQLFRKIESEVVVTEGDPRRITGIEARLLGVAASIDLRTGEVTGVAAIVPFPFVRLEGKLVGAVWVPGIIPGTAQRMAMTLTFSDGRTETVETDLSEMLKDFNADKLHPMRLTGDVYAPVNSETGGTIIGWTETSGSDVNAGME
jgi:hypothetical protein